jgi:exo-rhamnogalacturonan lyase-like protein
MHIPILATSGGVEPSQDARRGEPLTFGLPLPRGLTLDVEGWTFAAAGGAAQLVQARVLDRWADGSVRWALVDVQADIAAGGTAFSLNLSPHRPADVRPSAVLDVTSTGGVVTVDTGACRFQMRSAGGFPFDAVLSGTAPRVNLPSPLLTITDAQGAPHRVNVDAIDLEESGLLRSVVRVMGSVSVQGDRSLKVSARLHFFAGLPTIRMLITVLNSDRAIHEGGFWDLGDPGSILLKDVALTLRSPAGAGDFTVAASVERGDGQLTRYDAPFEIYQDSSGGENWQSSNHLNRERRVPNTFRGYRLRSGDRTSTGLRATPIVQVEHQGGRLAATLPHFWENFPKAVEVTHDTLVLRLFPGQYADVHELQGGEQKTHECFVSFGPDPVTTMPLAWARARTVATPTPEWCLSSQAVPFLAQLEPAHAALVNVGIEGPHRFELKCEVIDEYGWRHFGDMYGDHESVRQPDSQPLISHYNNQYDAIASFGYQFLRTADRRWFHLMTNLASHVIDIDVYHTSQDKWTYNHGMFWHTYHYGDADTATHRSYPRKGLGKIHGGGPSADHNYTTGLMLHYFLTGDSASRDTVVELADYVIAMDDGRRNVLRWLDRGDTGRAALSAPGYYGPGRGPANSLVALMDGYRLSGAARFSQKADQLVRRVVHPDDVLEKHGLSDPEQRWFYTMFLQSLGRYLESKNERGEHDDTFAYAQASLLHYARWMVAHEYPTLEKPEKVNFPTETWPAQDIRKSDVLYFAALHSDQVERDSFLERARFFFWASINTLSTMPTRVFTRPIAILLCSGYMHSWAAGQLHTYPSVTRPSFGSPVAFRPQRQRAERRLKWLAVTGVVVLATLAILLVSGLR